jgi:hypothetical protein
MARMRTLKPEFFRDKKIRQLTPTAALVYQAIWCMADDGGVAPADPERIYGEMFIGWTHVTLADITVALSELSGSTRIALYRVGDDVFAEIPKFTEHQKPSHPSKYRYPRGGERVTENTPVALMEPSASVISSQVSGIRSQVSGEQLLPAASAAGEKLPAWTQRAIAVYQEFVPHPCSPGRILRVLKPFVERDGAEVVLAKWREYCRNGRHYGLDGTRWTEPPLPVSKQSPERFRDTYEHWGKPVVEAA